MSDLQKFYRVRRILSQIGIYAWGQHRPERNTGPWWGPNANLSQEPPALLIIGRPGMGKGFHALRAGTHTAQAGVYLGTTRSQ